MTEPYRLLGRLDPVLRHPTRFALMTLLIVSGPLTEGEAARKLGLAWGPLSTHLSKLVEAGYVEKRRYPTLKGPRVFLTATEEGVRAYREYVEALEEVVEYARRAGLGGQHGGGGRPHG